MWSGSPRSSWCALCAVEVCVRTSMAWSSVSLLCVSFGWTRRFLRRIFVVAPHNVSFATCNSRCDDCSYWIRVICSQRQPGPGGQMAPPVLLRRTPPCDETDDTAVAGR